MRSVWRFFPLIIVAAIGLVVVVNGGMIYAAVHSFPGKANDAAFALSNHYDSVLARAASDAALGWSVVASSGADGRPTVMLCNRDGVPLRAAVVSGIVSRPVGAAMAQRLAFWEVTAGHYVADQALAAGQWDVSLTTSIAGHEVAVTRRILVR